MKVKKYEDYTDNEILVLIKNFNLEPKKTIFLTIYDFLSDILLFENFDKYFHGWESITYTLHNKEYTDYICKKGNSGYFCYVVDGSRAKIGEFMGDDYLMSLRNQDFRFEEFSYPTSINNLAKICENNTIDLFWNIKEQNDNT